ncbi:MAG TPA: CPBP family intramembrane glutamic endopeptidase [Edaphobacter sp.]
MSYASDLTTTRKRTGRILQLARFVATLAWSASSWLLAASSARGITHRLNIPAWQPFLSALFLLFLLAVGYLLLEMIARRPASFRSVLALPRRPSAGTEWLIGAALGWGMVVLAILPMALTGSLHVTFWTGPGTMRLLLITLLTLAAQALAIEVIFRGYAFRCLIETTGPVVATIVMSILFGLIQAILYGAGTPGIWMAIFIGVLLSVSWLRTHGLWIAWGLHFAWSASMGVLFGLPVKGSIDSAVLVQTIASGRRWFTGGSYGPEAARFTALALLAGLIVLVRVTRDYAWNYTHAPILPGGYPMEAKPPAAHVAMEQEQQNRPPALIQILPAPPQGRSADDPPDV